ncbi:ABC-type transport system involved in multi-copper enzyme maturation permease subunit [Mycetocola sp. CAN_C7]|uniref:ABC-2 transporter permease n=1 Tax=Mycetocola sp. CAN_C7 TaxID=2787724 RepID=UPI0018C9D12E
MTITFARFDLTSWLARTQTLLPLAFIVIISVILPVQGMAIVASAIVTTLLVSAPFLGDERGRLDTLYGVLPVSRTTIVTGRTLAILVLNVIAVAIANASTVIIALVRGDELMPQTLLLANAAAFAIVGLAMCLQLPVFFRVGYSRGRLISYAPAFVIVGLAWVVQETGLETSGLSVPVPTVATIGFAIGALGAVLGTLLAIRVYRRRELR